MLRRLVVLMAAILLWAAAPGLALEKQPAADLLDVYFSTSRVGFAVGRQGGIYRTDDGGKSWQAQASGQSVDLRSVHFSGVKNGWACGDNGTILHTEDGGQTWAPVVVQEAQGETLNRVAFIGPDNGWICGSHGLLLHTTDGGKTWVSVPSGTRHNLEGMTWESSDLGWIVGGTTILKGTEEAIILHTADGGQRWTEQPCGLKNSYLRTVAFLNARVGWAAGDSLVTTTNGGHTWTPVAGPFEHVPLYTVAFQSPQVGWLGGAHGALFATRDGGRTWKRQQSGTTREIRRIFLYENTQVAVGAGNDSDKGDKAAVLRTQDEGKSWLH